MMRRAILCAALAVAGCATEPVPADQARYARSVMNVALTKPEPGKVAQTFKRDTGFLGGGCTFRLYVSGTPFADLETGETVTAYLAPGDYIVGVRPANALCGSGNAEMEVIVKPGVARIFRVSVDSAGSVRLQPTAF